MIKLSQVVIVEGKYDKIKLSSFLDAEIITTDGFRIFKDKQKVDMLRRIALEKGVIILTDSDSAGFLIRGHLTGVLPKEKIINVFIPEIKGKEKRKTEQSA
jgi:ribonuclease M5